MIPTLIRWILMPVAEILFNVDVEGKNNLPKGSFIIAANHNDNSDPVFITKAVKKNIYYLAKKRLFLPPFKTRFLVKLTKNIPIKKGIGESTKVLNNVNQEYLNKGKIFGIFPEGTTAGGRLLLEPKTGVARIALISKKPVVPIAINGTFGALPRENKWFKKYPKVKVTIGKPMTFEEYSCQEDRQTLKKISNEIMEEIKILYNQNFDRYDNIEPKQKKKFIEIERPKPITTDKDIIIQEN
tara:strand:- start:983 stop:1705 length:723 start_codon:yes stop_codon:yes gene_type:complete